MKKVVVISYFSPPSSKAGAHRAYAMAEYLPEFGWEPVFIAPENGYYGRLGRYDYALSDVLEKFPVFRTSHFYPFRNGRMSLVARGARRLWDGVFIPDGRVLWNREVKKHISRIVSEHRPSVFFITSAPFSSFLLAPYLEKEFGLPVVLDYRDPWASNPHIERNRLRARLAIALERKALGASSLVTTASYHMIPYIKNSLGKAAEDKQFFGFPYGFNGGFFRREILPLAPNELPLNPCQATFAGFVHGTIDAEKILRGISLALDMDSVRARNLRFCCYGTLFGYTKDPQLLIEKHGLESWVRVYPFFQYREFLEVLRQSSFLILPHGDTPVARVLYPTKLFDYLGVRRPILYIGGDGQVAETIRDLKAGLSVEPQPGAIAEAVTALLDEHNRNAWYSEESLYRRLDRRHIFREFCRQLDQLSEKSKVKSEKQ